MYKKILVPIDGSTTSNRGLSEAIQLAANQGAILRLFHTVSERFLDCGYASGTNGAELIASAREDGHKLMAKAEHSVRDAGVAVETVMAESMQGSVASLILEQAREWPADLIVMGTHGRQGVARWAMGSEAESVVRAAPVPVLLVHDVLQSDPRVLHTGMVADFSTQILYA
jgi:nucleotide-binding universal stress UspA family protein